MMYKILQIIPSSVLMILLSYSLFGKCIYINLSKIQLMFKSIFVYQNSGLNNSNQFLLSQQHQAGTFSSSLLFPPHLISSQGTPH